jgi:hypothetical protein
MFWLWLIGVVVIGMYLGYQYGKADAYTKNEIGTMLIVIVLFWPFALALAIALAPFVGMVYLGARSKKKEK